MKRYIVTIDRDGIDRVSAAPILIEDTRTGEVQTCADVRLIGLPEVHYSATSPLRNGARVWIEAWDVEVIR